MDEGLNPRFSPAEARWGCAKGVIIILILFAAAWISEWLFALWR